jgi:hypothetical protein
VQPDEVLTAMTEMARSDPPGLRLFKKRFGKLVIMWNGCTDADKARHHLELAKLNKFYVYSFGYHVGSIIKRALRTPAGQSPERDEIVRLCVELVRWVS